MRKQTRSSFSLATKVQTGIFDGANHQKSNNNNNKRGNSAKGHSLLPLALRPRLFGVVGVTVGITTLAIFSVFYNNANVSAVNATLTIPNSISVNVDPNKNNGFAESSNEAVSVSTGNQMGYTLTIKAKDSNQLKNGSNVLNSITSNLTADQYKSGNYVNTWGFKPSEINNESNTSYVRGPNSSTGITLASTHASSNDAENYSIGIAAKVDSNTIAGNYTNTFTIAATANEATYTIKYNANGGSPTPATQSDNFDTETTVTIEGAAPTNSNGKDFLGWCTEDPGDSDTCTGALIQPNGKFPLCKCDLNITLWAMWGEKPLNIGTADGSDCMINNYMTGKVYGGNCWMWEDLAGTYYWSDAQTACPVGTHLPSNGEFTALVNIIGNKGQLYESGWKASSKYYWSSTGGQDDCFTGTNCYGGYLYVTNSSATVSSVSLSSRDYQHNVRCIAG